MCLFSYCMYVFTFVCSLGRFLLVGSFHSFSFILSSIHLMQGQAIHEANCKQHIGGDSCPSAYVPPYPTLELEKRDREDEEMWRGV